LGQGVGGGVIGMVLWSSRRAKCQVKYCVYLAAVVHSHRQLLRLHPLF